MFRDLSQTATIPVGMAATTKEALGKQFGLVLEAAQAGAEWAWERIYDALSPEVLGYLRAQGSPDPEAICGEVFFQVVRDIHKFEGDAAGFRAWVFTIARHKVIDDARHRKRRPELLTEPSDLADIEDGSDVEEVVLGRAGESELRLLIDGLKPSQREVLFLRIFGGLTCEEVSQAVGRRVGAVKALQRRGLESIRRNLKLANAALEAS
jgi:RNA polymerase sigma-70 factor (ECF subfamily)